MHGDVPELKPRSTFLPYCGKSRTDVPSEPPEFPSRNGAMVAPCVWPRYVRCARRYRRRKARPEPLIPTAARGDRSPSSAMRTQDSALRPVAAVLPDRHAGDERAVLGLAAGLAYHLRHGYITGGAVADASQRRSRRWQSHHSGIE